ncbi:MAG TPA: hypothetical protein PKN75_15165 [Bacteroidia bacterium]|nr:hypothetical protein [Bacteroidia bacterium]HNU34925.1 hypothetical protein [Bacteroidia bacterium]
MKKNKLILMAAVALLTTATIFTGCKKDDDDTPAPTPNTEQKLSFHLHTMVGSNAASYGVQYQDASGRKFDIADLRYYISNIVLIKNDGSELALSGKVLLVNPATQEYELGEVPVGSYKGFKFLLGLDSTTNHSDPTTYSASNPLSIQSPSIHWSWNSGYIFMKIEGQVDTTLAANGPLDLQYFYHVGLDQLKRTIDFSTSPFTVVSGSDYEIGLEFDLLQALNNVDMRTENETHSFNNLPLATKIADNWQDSFELE